MALYDSADCLQRCRDTAQLPEDDEAMDDAAWYRLLTAAQAQWVTTMSPIVADALLGAPERLESADGGATFTFGTDADGRPVVPLGQVRLFRTEADASRPDWWRSALTPGVEFRTEGDRVRLAHAGAVAFPDGGPWAVYIEPPGAIDATNEPTLLPVAARELLVLTAVEMWASQGGLRDPGPFVGRAAKAWSGGGTPGDVGLLGALRSQYFEQAAPAARRGPARGTTLARWGARR